MIYAAINEPVLLRLPKTVRRLLDLGCGTGALARRIKKQWACEIVGITFSNAEAAIAGDVIDNVFIRDLNDFDVNQIGQFDCIVGSHVLEHLYNPQRLLELLHNNLTSDGRLIIALPNVLHWRQRMHFLSGRFRYTDGGLMDRTHYRFYDWKTARDLLVDSGYTISERKACGTFPLSRFLFGFGRILDSIALRVLPGLFGYQFLFVCRSARNQPNPREK